MPKIYGSAKGFFTIACIITPHTAKPAPTIAAKTSRGKRNNQIISCTGPFPIVSILVPLCNCSIIVKYIFSNGNFTVPILKAQNNIIIKIIINNKQINR